MITWLKKHDITVCDELYRQGYITEEEFKKDVEYGRENVSHTMLLLYKLLIIPIVYAMKYSSFVTRVVYAIADKFWFRRFL